MTKLITNSSILMLAALLASCVPYGTLQLREQQRLQINQLTKHLQEAGKAIQNTNTFEDVKLNVDAIVLLDKGNLPTEEANRGESEVIATVKCLRTQDASEKALRSLGISTLRTVDEHFYPTFTLDVFKITYILISESNLETQQTFSFTREELYDETLTLSEE